MIPDLLLWLTLFPLLGAAACIPLSDRMSKHVALVTSLVGVALAAVLFQAFDGAQSTLMQLRYSSPWIPKYGVQFALGVDGLSFALVLLTKLTMPVAILASWRESRKVRAFMINFLVLDFAMTGTFLATDLFLFYVFWELMLVPMLILIGVWGSKDRIYAALKFFIFTFAGSILMLASVFWVFTAYQNQFGQFTSEIASFSRLVYPAGSVVLGLSVQDLIFIGFTLAFLIKVPLFPLHTWLPDAHVQAPTGGSIILAAVLLKMGTYGLLRFSIPIAPQGFAHFADPLAILSLIGIVYGAWVAFQQTDMKKLVAYSSVSHLGFVVLGICAMNTLGLTGAMLQMINHGLSTGALFLIVGMLYERRHSRNFADYGGIAEVVPWLSIALVFVACSSMGVPGLNGFVGEFLVLFGTFQAKPWWAIIAVSGVIFGAAYMLIMVRKVLFGQAPSSENKQMKDMNWIDWAAFSPLAILIVVLGVAPSVLTHKFSSTLENYWKTYKPSTAITEVLPNEQKSALADSNRIGHMTSRNSGHE